MFVSLAGRVGCLCTRVLKASTHAISIAECVTVGTGQSAAFLEQNLISWNVKRTITAGHSGMFDRLIHVACSTYGYGGSVEVSLCLSSCGSMSASDVYLYVCVSCLCVYFCLHVHVCLVCVCVHLCCLSVSVSLSVFLFLCFYVCMCFYMCIFCVSVFLAS